MTTAPKPAYGKELISWEVAEYDLAPRGVAWYVFAGVAAVGLLIWAVSTRNFLFAFIVLIFAVIFATHTMRPPQRYRFVISDIGLALGSRLHKWKDVQGFWILYEPPEVKMLYLDFGGIRPRLPIPLERMDPNQVRKILKEFIIEDTGNTEEPMLDWLARMLKI